ncbi:MAG: SpoIIE family protein phosphatase [Bacteroidota bacterium]|jgi:serine phosphatase RsbU (regulator of sigma subunit)
MLRFAVKFFALVWLLCFCGYCPTIQAQTKACETLIEKANSIYSSNPDSSFAISQQALQCATANNDSLQLANALAQIGRYQLLKSNLHESETSLNKALTIFNRFNEKKGIAYVYKLKAILQGRLQNNKGAIEFAEQAVALYEETKSEDGIIASLQNLTNYYLDEKDTNKLRITFERLEQLLKNKSPNNQYYYYQNKSKYWMLLQRYSLADKMLRVAYTIASNENMIDSKATITMIRGRNYRYMNKLPESEKILLESETICKANQLNHELVETYTELVETYKQMGNYKAALTYFDTLTKINNSIINLEKVNEIAQLEKKLLETEKQKEIDFEKEKTSAALGKNKKLLTSLLLITILLVISVYLFIRTRKLKNNIHEKSVLIEQKASELASRQKEIVDSINYAKKIQYALLANRQFIAEHLKDNFIFFKPKAIVSGDFYWAASVNALNENGTAQELFYLAVCDSTGHGVPGAFMSLLSIGFLSEAVNEKHLQKPNEIFDYVRQRIISSMSAEDQKDGFDGVLICVNKISGELTYAAANNQPVLIENNELTELGADKMPVGLGERKEHFTLRHINAKPGSMLYLYTDGFADQFGGPKGKKFKYKQLNELLIKHHIKPLNEQQNSLSETFENWKGDLEQVDDVCVIGIKI